MHRFWCPLEEKIQYGPMALGSMFLSLVMLLFNPLLLLERCNEVLPSLNYTRNIFVMSVCILIIGVAIPSGQALKATATMRRDHIHLDMSIVAKYPHQELVRNRQLRFSSLWSFSKILLITRGAINETYSRELGEHVHIKNFSMSLMIGSTQTSLLLSYDVYGVVESYLTLGGTSFKTDCRWRYLSIDKRYPVSGEIWVNLSQTLFLNFSCFDTSLRSWKKTMIGTRTIIFQNVSSFVIPYQIGSRTYGVEIDPSMQIATPSNAYDVSQDDNHISFSLAVLPFAYIVMTILLIVITVLALLLPRLRQLWRSQSKEQRNM